MKLPPFLLDEWIEHYNEGRDVRHNLAASTGPAWTLEELLALASEEERPRTLATPLTYMPAHGSRALRERIAALHGVHPDEIVVTTGAEEALHILFFLAAEPGGNVVVSDPCFPPMQALPESLGLEVRRYRLRPEAGFRIDPDEVARLIDARTKLVLVNSPHNPTGVVVGDGELRALADACARRKVPLVTDEVYHPLYYAKPGDAAPHASGSELPGVTVMSDFSKALCLSGLRLGWLVERDAVRRAQYHRARMYFTISSSALGEALAVLALDHRSTILERAQSLGESNLSVLQNVLERQRELVGWVRPSGGTLAFPWLTFTEDSRPFAEALAAAGVLIIPGDCFGWPRHFRVGFAASTTFDEALPAFERVLEDLAAGVGVVARTGAGR